MNDGELLFVHQGSKTYANIKQSEQVVNSGYKCPKGYVKERTIVQNWRA